MKPPTREQFDLRLKQLRSLNTTTKSDLDKVKLLDKFLKDLQGYIIAVDARSHKLHLLEKAGCDSWPPYLDAVAKYNQDHQ